MAAQHERCSNCMLNVTVTSIRLRSIEFRDLRFECLDETVASIRS